MKEDPEQNVKALINTAQVIEATPPAIEETAEEIKEERPYFFFPNSPTTNIMYTVLQAGKQIESYTKRKEKISDGKYKTKIFPSGLMCLNYQSKEKIDIDVHVSNFDKISKSTNASVKKLFILLLRKLNEQAVHNGVLTQDHVSFSLNELMVPGWYNSERAARRGFYAGAELISCIKIRVRKDAGRFTKELGDGGAITLFPDYAIEQNQCYIFLSERPNWKLITEYFTLLPNFYFNLSNRAADLLEYIFIRARECTSDIQTKGCFNIPFRTIQVLLLLPEEKGNRDAKHLVKKELLDAIKLITDENKKACNKLDFTLKAVYDPKAPVSSFLDNGYLKVTLKNEIAENFGAISRKRNALIEEATEKKAKKEKKAEEKADKKAKEKTNAET